MSLSALVSSYYYVFVRLYHPPFNPAAGWPALLCLRCRRLRTALPSQFERQPYQRHKEASLKDGHQPHTEYKGELNKLKVRRF